MQVSTDPGDATIYVDGKRNGNSPENSEQAFVIQLKEGEYLVEARAEVAASGGKFKRENYARKSVFIADDTIQSVSLKLELILAPGQEELPESSIYRLGN